MLVRYFRRPSRIEQLRSSTGGHLLGRYMRCCEDEAKPSDSTEPQYPVCA